MIPAARALLAASASAAGAAARPSVSASASASAVLARRGFSTPGANDSSGSHNNNHNNNNKNADNGDQAAAALYITSPEGGARGATPLLLGLTNYFERHVARVGYFLPVGGPSADRDPRTGADPRAELVAAASDHRALGDPRLMVAVPEEEAARLMASGRASELLDRIYSAFAAARLRHDVVVVEGTGVGGSEFEAQVCAALGTPVLLTLNAAGPASASSHHHSGDSSNNHAGQGALRPGASGRARPPSLARAGGRSGGGGGYSGGAASASAAASAAAAGDLRLAASDIYSAVMVKRQLFADHGVPLLGVAVNRAPAAEQALLARQLRRRFGVAGVTFAGAMPEDPVLSGVRLGEVQARLGAGLLYGGGGGGGSATGVSASSPPLSLADAAASPPPAAAALASGLGLSSGFHVDREFNAVVVASQRLEELLEALEAMPPGRRPLVVTTADRLDLVLGLLAAHVSACSPPIAGIVLCPTSTGLEVEGGGGGGGFGLGDDDAFGGGGSHQTTHEGAIGGAFGEAPPPHHRPRRSPHAFARRTVQRIFEGLARGGMYRGALLPVLAVGAPVYDVARALGEMTGQILPSSARKIGQCQLSGRCD